MQAVPVLPPQMRAENGKCPSGTLFALHARGYGVTIATWAGEAEVAAVAYLGGRPVTSAHAATLDAALERLRLAVLAGEERL